jgi:hypothetical protein
MLSVDESQFLKVWQANYDVIESLLGGEMTRRLESGIMLPSRRTDYF